MNYCSANDCDRPILAKGLCSSHYRREHRGTGTTGPIRGKHGAIVSSTDLMECIRHSMKDGQSPSTRELAECLGVSPSRVHVWLHKLQDEGQITMRQGQPRSIEITEGK